MKNYRLLLIIILVSCSFYSSSYQALQIQEAETSAEDISPVLKPAFLVLNLEEGQDLILSSYRDPALKKDVLAFFEDITGSLDIAEIILTNACFYDISPALAFSLAAEESSFITTAINRNQNNTIDRGLFQLNSASFPKLTLEDFFNPATNARHGLAHLRWCLNTAGTEVSGLAMYNAGATRVGSVGTPKSTLDYVSRILRRQRSYEERFIAEYVRIAEERKTQAELDKRNSQFSFTLLTTLGRR